jgi:hypothetical protein
MPEPEIFPLCDLHFSLMEPARRPDTKDAAGLPFFRCSISGCTRHYDPLHGYLDVINGQPLADQAEKTQCSRDERAMYMASYNSGSRMEVWRCPDVSCRAERTARG